jgi:acetoin utilization deacetylase AcuC-like enzyme
MSLSVISSPRFAMHTPPPGHPERPERADVFDVVAGRWRAEGGTVLEPRAATRDELLRVHTATHVDRIEQTRGRAAMLDPDTFTSPESADLAALAAGAALVGLEAVCASSSGDALEAALVAVRPPGHHAEADHAMGFCFYNNVAVAAAAALARGFERVAIVDFDVHHGNGTQHSFERDPRVLFVSTHQYPFYPGTGAATEIGLEDGAGFTVNIPLEAGATNGDYAQVFDAVVLPILDAFAPQLLLVSAGFDADARDPLAHMRLTPDGFTYFASALASSARRHAAGRILAITEGGYDLEALREGLEALTGVFAGRRVDATSLDDASGRGDRAIAAVRAAQKGRWRGL